MAEDLYDPQVLNEVKSVMKARFSVVLQYFLEDSEGYVNTIKSAVANSNAAEIVLPAHTLKSSAKQMGAMLLSARAQRVEELARNASSDTIDKIKTLLGDLDSVLAATSAQYSKM